MIAPRTMGSSDKPLTILFVEDNPDHAELVMRSLEDHQVANRIFHVSDGEAALDYLFRRGAYSDASTSPRPHVVLLDLRLPKVDGLQVLERMKAAEELEQIPVVVLTTSHADQDVSRAYEHHVNSYLVKPLDFERFSRMIDDLGFYWLRWNHTPKDA